MPNRRIAGLSTLFRVALAVSLCAALAGCSMFALKRDLERMDAVARISGTIAREDPSRNPIIVGLLEQRVARDAVVDYTVLREPGEFSFLAKAGTYFVLAYEDTNGNLSYDQGEPAAFHGDPSPLEVVAGEILDGLTLELSSTVSLTLHADPQQRVDTPPPNLRRSTQNIGERATLDDERFARDVGSMGMWEPVSFAREHGLGVFLLEEYDPARIPVVFVHGLAGTPRDFTAAIERLPRDRYQPWVFHYASGLPVEVTAEYLEKALMELQVKLGFERYAVVAHSLGGLVARRFVNRIHDHAALLPSALVTFSTPWGGHEGARMGVKHSPQVVPVWRDQVPGSALLTALFLAPLPTETPHFLLFGYAGDSMMMSGADDGVVSVASQLHMPAQEGARRVYGFDANHVGILSHPGALRVFYRALERSLDDRE